MRFKIDENLPGELVSELRQAGHEADTVFDEGMSGAADADILARVQIEKRVFLTLDKGVADIREYPPDQYWGIVLFRPPTAGRSETLTFIRQHLHTLLQADPTGRLFVVSAAGIRAR
jgi:predicted nuclease of predicted toxin-antitoxin system